MLTVERHAPRDRGVVGRQSDHRQGGEGLARSRLADDGEAPAALDGERDVVDHHLVAERHGEVGDVEQRLAPLRSLIRPPTGRAASLPAAPGTTPVRAAMRCRRSRGSVASRRPSPRRLKPRVASTSASPGSSTGHGCTVTVFCRPLRVQSPRRPTPLGEPEVGERRLGEDRRARPPGTAARSRPARCSAGCGVAPCATSTSRTRGRGEDVVLGEHAVALGAQDPRQHHARPEAEGERHGEQRRLEQPDQHDGQHQRRNGDEHVDEVGDRLAEIARRDRADHGEHATDHAGDQRRRERHEQADAGPDQHLREQVGTTGVGAEEVIPRDRQPVLAGIRPQRVVRAPRCTRRRRRPP